ncbi:hypothetical protein ANCDUO_04264 [Ancylostoma duodenale]|uniref:Uncharacterized protein n=1 Tax=Ancylostoma duodenale TaxID=51022 RepID=A0A0C2DRP9_9BILA|nr:hypothetical protein ANCDUO_04264 [Ancylostoma duodenale]
MHQDLIACVTDTTMGDPGTVEQEAVDMSVSSGAEFSDDESQVCLSIIKLVKGMKVSVIAELSKHFRMGDERRNQMEDLVESKSREIMKTVRDLRKAVRMRAKGSDDTAQLLKETMNCESLPVARERLSSLLKSEKRLRKIALRLECDERSVRGQVRTLLKEKADGLAQIEQLQRSGNEANEEIRALKAELEAQKRRVAELEAENGSHTHVEASEAVIPGEYSRPGLRNQTHSETSMFQHGSHRVVRRRGYRHRSSSCSSGNPERTEGTPALNQSSESESGRDESRDRVSNVPMNEYLKFVALPDVQPYSGRDKDYSFENFQEAFELKYPREHWSDKERCALFKAKLTGKARAQYEALPRDKRKGRYSVLTSAMREVCKTESRNRKVVALSELKRLQKMNHKQ